MSSDAWKQRSSIEDRLSHFQTLKTIDGHGSISKVALLASSKGLEHQPAFAGQRGNGSCGAFCVLFGLRALCTLHGGVGTIWICVGDAEPTWTGMGSPASRLLMRHSFGVLEAMRHVELGCGAGSGSSN